MEDMELSDRKKQILRAIIDDYISTALPVGSKSLADHHGLQVSSATIRSEMNELEELGFLAQPHTSAGRIPSQSAYRVYVDHLLHISALPKVDARHIHSYFEAEQKQLGNVEQVLSSAARALSEVTQYISVVMAPKLSGSPVRHLQLVYISPRAALLVLVTDAGIIKDTVIHLPFDITPELLERASRMLNRMLVGKSLKEARLYAIGEIAKAIHSENALLAHLSELINSQLKAESDVLVEGAAGVLAHPEYTDVAKARSLLAFLQQREQVSNMLCSMRTGEAMEICVRIGRENENEALSECSTVTATYRLNGQTIGQLGVIGPVRMQYGRVISVLDCLRQTMEEILSQTRLE